MTKKEKELFKYIEEYYNSHPGDYMELDALIYVPVDKQFDYVGATMQNLFLAIKNNVSFTKEGNIEFLEAYKKRDFVTCRIILEDLYKHAYFAFTLSWKDAPKRLNRKILMPVRSSVGDLMYAALAAFRTDAYHLVNISNNNVSFRSYVEDINDLPLRHVKEVYADNYPLFVLFNENNLTLEYDYGDDWLFSIRKRKPVYLKNEDYPYVIVQGGNGYGIYEDNRYDLYQYICGEDVELPFNFEELDLEELKKSVNPMFVLIKNGYFGLNE